MEVVCANLVCGKTFEFKGGVAHFNRTKQHFCSRSCQNVIHGLSRRLTTDKRYEIWCGVKKRAKQNGTIFSLLIEDIPDIPLVCPILGIKIEANNIAGPLDSSPSLDRIIPSLGYIRGNIRIISNRANRLRSDATTHELFLLTEDSKKIDEKF
jgi:hypothetical protein